MTDTTALSLQNTRIATFADTLGKSIKAIASVLPNGTKPERICRIAVTELQRNPALINCSPHSFLLSVLGACSLGLDIGGPLGQAYLVPYGQTCQLIPGYRGLIKLAINSGHVTHITADVVRVGDTFEYRTGTEPSLLHVPAEAPIVDGMPDPSWKPGEPRAFYAVGHLRDEFKVVVVMQRWEVDKIRDGSQGYQRNKNTSPWTNHYAEMGKKTAIRRLGKLLPASAERLQYALALEDAADVAAPQPFDLIPDMPEVPEPETPPIDATATESPAPAPQKTPEEKRRQDALKGLIIEMGKRGVTGKEQSIAWINARLDRKIASRNELTEAEIADLRKKLDERQAGEE